MPTRNIIHSEVLPFYRRHRKRIWSPVSMLILIAASILVATGGSESLEPSSHNAAGWGLMTFVQRQWPIVLFCGVALLIAAMLQAGRELAHLAPVSSAALADHVSYRQILQDNRRTWAQVMGAIGLAGVAVFAVLNYRLTQDKDLSDRFSQAVELLGSTRDANGGVREINTEARLGAIYALEKIARDSPEYQAAVIDVLSAYARLNSSPDSLNGQAARDRVRVDIEAAVIVIGRREIRRQESPLYLDRVYLRGARLSGARLSGAELNWAILSSADLRGVDLESAKLYSADLTDAFLQTAILRGADLRESYLNNALLIDTVVAGADLRGVRDLAPNQLKRARGIDDVTAEPAVTSTSTRTPERPSTIPSATTIAITPTARSLSTERAPSPTPSRTPTVSRLHPPSREPGSGDSPPHPERTPPPNCAYPPCGNDN